MTPVPSDPGPPAPREDVGLPPAKGRALTPRAIIIGAALAVLLAIATPINDFGLHNTLLYCHYLPPGVTLLMLVIGLGNGLLGRRRLAMGELAVITGMMLVVGGVASSGLARYLPYVIAGPARALSSDPSLAPLTPAGGDIVLPSPWFVGIPRHGSIDINDPEYRYVIDGYHEGLGDPVPNVAHRAEVTWTDGTGRHTMTALGGAVARERKQRGGAPFLDLDAPLGRALAGHRPGETVLGPQGQVTINRVIMPGVPWYAWWSPALHWAPLILGFLCSCIALAALVRRQWQEHERLPFPITSVYLAFIQDPIGKARLGPLLSNRGFWIGLAISSGILLTQGLNTWGYLPIFIPTHFDLNDTFSAAIFRQGFSWWAVWNPRLFFSVAGLVFFLPLDMGFSLWFFFIGTYVVTTLAALQGLPIPDHVIELAAVGGFWMEILLILWVGRFYYMRALRAAVRPTSDPEQRQAGVAIRWLAVGGGAMIASMMAMGVRADIAVLAVVIVLGVVLVLGRLVAEAGVPFIQQSAFPAQVIFSLTGYAFPLAVLAPLAMIGPALLGDSRENLLPYALHAEVIGQRSGVNGWRWTTVLMVVVAVTAALSCATLVAVYYRMDNASDGWPMIEIDNISLQDVVDGWVHQSLNGQRITALWSYGGGMAICALVGISRLFFAWWPLHPLGYLVSMTYPTKMIWFSFLIGWLAKFLVMRYGGSSLYQRMKPVALGLITGEAAIAVVFLVAAVILRLCGIQMSAQPSFLPG